MFWCFWEFSFLENYDFSLQLREFWQWSRKIINSYVYLSSERNIQIFPSDYLVFYSKLQVMEFKSSKFKYFFRFYTCSSIRAWSTFYAKNLIFIFSIIYIYIYIYIYIDIIPVTPITQFPMPPQLLDWKSWSWLPMKLRIIGGVPWCYKVKIWGFKLALL